METAKEKVQQALDKCEQSNVSEWSVINLLSAIHLADFIRKNTQKTDDLPIIMEI